MIELTRNKGITRRDFVRLGLVTGSALALAPFLKACAGLGEAGSTSSTPQLPVEDLLESLDGLGLDQFFEESFRILVLRDPEGVTELGLGEIYAVGNDALTDVSDDFIRETQALEAGILERLLAYDVSGMTPEQAMSARVYGWYLDDLVRGHAFMYDDYPINPIVTSLHLRLIFLFTEYHPLNTEQDAEDYLERLRQVGTKIDQIIAGLALREERGVILPGFIIDVVLPDLTGIADALAVTTPFYWTLSTKLQATPAVSSEKRIDFLDRAAKVIEETVVPAYGRLADALTAQRSKAPREVGVWQFSDGEEYYGWSLRHHITTPRTAPEVEMLGREHLERIHGEMRLLFTSLGYPGSEGIPALYQRLEVDTGVYFGEGSVRAYEAAIAQAQALLPQAFDLLPRAEVMVIGGEAGDYYMPPAYDGSRPGIFWARTHQPTPIYGVKTLAFHETLPGHHLQIALAQEMEGQPAFRHAMGFNGFAEGWALYAEKLMQELGAYQDDLAGDLGRLQAEAFRAARLVVDTGIHTGVMGFDAAVDFLAGATGFEIGYAQREITRYAVWAGQATAYYTGFLKILELKTKAMEALGEAFDLKAFHRVVIGNGALPLEVLEDMVTGIIEAAA